MRRIYREKIYQCGDYKEVYIYPCRIVGKPLKGRRKKARPTPEGVKRINRKNTENKLVRLLNANFTEEDLSLDLTYKDNPAEDAAALKSLQNFLRRLKRARERRGLGELQYIAVTEKGSQKGRFHHHLVISGGIDIKELGRIWGKGLIKVSPLQFNETGLIGKGRYMVKQSIYFKAFNASKNLIHPQPTIRDGRLSQKRVEELWRDSEDRAAYEKLYEGYIFAEADNYFSESDGGYYICARFYRKDFNLQKKKEKSAPCGTVKSRQQKSPKISGLFGSANRCGRSRPKRKIKKR